MGDDDVEDGGMTPSEACQPQFDNHCAEVGVCGGVGGLAVQRSDLWVVGCGFGCGLGIVDCGLWGVS